jgi:hypothetical protein
MRAGPEHGASASGVHDHEGRDSRHGALKNGTNAMMSSKGLKSLKVLKVLKVLNF